MTTCRFMNDVSIISLFMILYPTPDQGQSLMICFVCVMPLEMVQVGFANQPRSEFISIYEKFY